MKFLFVYQKHKSQKCAWKIPIERYSSRVSLARKTPFKLLYFGMYRYALISIWILYGNGKCWNIYTVHVLSFVDMPSLQFYITTFKNSPDSCLVMCMALPFFLLAFLFGGIYKNHISNILISKPYMYLPVWKALEMYR